MEFHCSLNNKSWEILAGILAASNDMEAMVRELSLGGRDYILQVIKEEEAKQCNQD
jgi:PleD family two-component response regulator